MEMSILGFEKLLEMIFNFLFLEIGNYEENYLYLRNPIFGILENYENVIWKFWEHFEK
jgi:hypothetical protein